MNPFEFVIAIVAIVTIGGIIRTKQIAKYGGRVRGHRSGILSDDGEGIEFDPRTLDSEEARALRQEVIDLKERIKVLERIAVDKENALAREIDSLRD